MDFTDKAVIVHVFMSWQGIPRLSWFRTYILYSNKHLLDNSPKHNLIGPIVFSKTEMVPQMRIEGYWEDILFVLWPTGQTVIAISVCICGGGDGWGGGGVGRIVRGNTYISIWEPKKRSLTSISDVKMFFSSKVTQRNLGGYVSLYHLPFNSPWIDHALFQVSTIKVMVCFGAQ